MTSQVFRLTYWRINRNLPILIHFRILIKIHWNSRFFYRLLLISSFSDIRQTACYLWLASRMNFFIYGILRNLLLNCRRSSTIFITKATKIRFIFVPTAMILIFLITTFMRFLLWICRRSSTILITKTTEIRLIFVPTVRILIHFITTVRRQLLWNCGGPSTI